MTSQVSAHGSVAPAAPAAPGWNPIKWLVASSAMVGCIGLFGAVTLMGQWSAPDGATASNAAKAVVAGPQNGLSVFAHEDLEIAATPRVPPVKRAKVTVRNGDTLMKILTKAGADRRDAYYAIEAMKPVFDPRHIKVGQTLEVGFARAFQDNPIMQPAEARYVQAGLSAVGADWTRLVGLSLQPDRVTTIDVRRDGDGSYTADKLTKDLTERTVNAAGTINSSLYLAAVESDIPHGVIAELIRIYSYDIDFQREIRKGDSFKVYFSRFYDDEGQAVKNGVIHYASMTTSGKEKELFRFTPSDDNITDYFDAAGKSAKQFLMRTPIDGARISSGFGRRVHPVLGYSKLHKGTDFAAPTGTPIKAAGNGVIERASRFGSFGNYIRIRHANGYKTAYAHLHRYARGIKKGRRVKQGQTIGYVGTTGRSTGPHLHYEVHYQGKAVNPMRVRIPSGRTLKGDVLTAFKAERDQIRADRLQTPLSTPVATAELVQGVSATQ